METWLKIVQVNLSCYSIELSNQHRCINLEHDLQNTKLITKYCIVIDLYHGTNLYLIQYQSELQVTKTAHYFR